MQLHPAEPLLGGQAKRMTGNASLDHAAPAEPALADVPGREGPGLGPLGTGVNPLPCRLRTLARLPSVTRRGCSSGVVGHTPAPSDTAPLMLCHWS